MSNETTDITSERGTLLAPSRNRYFQLMPVALLLILLIGFAPTLYLRMAFDTPAIPLYLHTQSVIDDLRLQRAVVEAVEQWDDEVRIVENDSVVSGGQAHVELLVVGRGEPRPVWQLAELIRDRYGGQVELRLLYQTDLLFVVSAL